METFPFTAKANERVRPGKQLLMFQVQLTASHGKRDFVLAREVDVGVLGESEMLKLLGVPSLLFLPGFLSVSAFLALWRWKVLRIGGDGDPPLKETESGFWVLSILVSLVISGAFIYLVRSDFFSFYGLGDLMTLWTVSFALGCVTYVGYRLIVNARESKRYPQPDDSPVQILRKLKQYGQSMDVMPSD